MDANICKDIRFPNNNAMRLISSGIITRALMVSNYSNGNVYMYNVYQAMAKRICKITDMEVNIGHDVWKFVRNNDLEALDDAYNTTREIHYFNPVKTTDTMTFFEEVKGPNPVVEEQQVEEETLEEEAPKAVEVEASEEVVDEESEEDEELESEDEEEATPVETPNNNNQYHSNNNNRPRRKNGRRH